MLVFDTELLIAALSYVFGTFFSMCSLKTNTMPGVISLKDKICLVLVYQGFKMRFCLVPLGPSGPESVPRDGQNDPAAVLLPPPAGTRTALQ